MENNKNENKCEMGMGKCCLGTKLCGFCQSKAFKIILVVGVALVVFIAVFKAGMFVGERKARFSYKWGENYHRNFAGPKKGFLEEFKRGVGEKDFINAHGTFGSIISVDNNTVIMKGQDNIEKTVIVSTSTTIAVGREVVQLNSLKADDKVVVIGAPNEQGQIEAKIIRLFNQDFRKVLDNK